MLTKIKEYLPKFNEKKFKIDYEIKGDKLFIKLKLFLYKYDLHWKTMKLRFVNQWNVKLINPDNWSVTLYEEEFIINWETKNITIDLSKIKNYSYKWLYIDSDLKILTELDDKIFFDTKLEKDIIKSIWGKLNHIVNSKAMINPKDKYDIYANFLALDKNKRLLILFIISIFSSLIIYWIFVLPFFLIQLAFFWFIIYKWFKNFLKNYMNFWFIKNSYMSYDKDKVYKLSELVTWKSNVNLKNFKVRVVAANMEKWTHVVWSWKSRKTVYFNNPVNWIILHEETINFLPKNTDISDYLKWSFSFKRMYEKLYPPFQITPLHWIDVRWEIQLIHNKFMDKEIVWPTHFIKYDNFIKKDIN